jgi:hypothetical protein
MESLIRRLKADITPSTNSAEAKRTSTHVEAMDTRTDDVESMTEEVPKEETNIADLDVAKMSEVTNPNTHLYLVLTCSCSFLRAACP